MGMRMLVPTSPVCPPPSPPCAQRMSAPAASAALPVVRHHEIVASREAPDTKVQ